MRIPQAIEANRRRYQAEFGRGRTSATHKECERESAGREQHELKGIEEHPRSLSNHPHKFTANCKGGLT